ncbi:MAG: alpha/beta hydrolase fold domain-containing protein [Candidatus Heimdallarchaeota archaeon]|nr:alpha/beta hydrolase fold domain-containing protein [Candidatus Heimdallarchaeota archaeon]
MNLNQIIEEILRSSQLTYLVLVFFAVSLFLYLLFLTSFSILGLWLSEAGLWLAWIPLTLIAIGFPFTIKMHFLTQINPINPFFMSIGIVANIITFMGLMIPFLQISMTNEKLKKAMEKDLGDDYLEIIEKNLIVRFTQEVKFKLIRYFLGAKARFIRKTLNIYKEIPYKRIGDMDLKLNAYAPRRVGSFPIIIFIHGGAWMLGSKDRGRDENVCKMLANHGYVVFNIDYRLFPRKANTIAEMLSDVRAAIKFVKQIGPGFGGDPKTVFLFGRSAGAHLSLLSAFTQQGPFFKEELGQYKQEDLEVSGVIAFYPPTNLEALYNFYKILAPKIAMAKIIGGKPEDKKELYQLFSPVSYLTEQNAKFIPPVFIATGLKDKLVAPTQSKELYEKLQRLNITTVLLEFPNANHGFDTIQAGPNSQLAYKYLLQFLAWVLSKEKESKQLENAETYQQTRIVLTRSERHPTTRKPFFVSTEEDEAKTNRLFTEESMKYRAEKRVEISER